MCSAAFCVFLAKWSSVLGVTIDILGAVLVYVGVRIGIAKATALEQIALGETIDEYGSGDLLNRNAELSAARAQERVRAARWAAFGLACFVIGFVLQGIGSWPKHG